MAISLNEDDVGRDREIWYPNLRNCMSCSLVLDDGTLLGAHMTLLTTLRAFEYMCKYFETERRGAKIVSILLIGNVVDWKMHDVEFLRSGTNLHFSLRSSLNTGCVIYQYDSVASEAGGLGAAAHVMHCGDAVRYPDVELVKADNWSNFIKFPPDHKAVQKLQIKHIFTPSPWAADHGSRSGCDDVDEVCMVRATGDATIIQENEMKQF